MTKVIAYDASFDFTNTVNMASVNGGKKTELGGLTVQEGSILS